MDKCKNCELLLQIDEDQRQWYEKLSMKNIELHKKLSEQQDLIYVLQNKLADKKINHYNEHIHQCVYDLDTEICVSEDEFIQDKVREMQDYLEACTHQMELFRKNVERSMDEMLENQSYLNGLAEFFRESYFMQLEKTNQLKRKFLENINEYVLKSSDALVNSLKNEEGKISALYKMRYQTMIKKTNDDLQKQTELMQKLRNHNRNLYKIIHDNKSEYIELRIEKDKIIENLRETVAKLSKKNENLQTQVKLQVQGCQTDIQQVRKQLRKILDQKNNQYF